MDDVGQYSQKNNLINSGLRTRHRSYTSVVVTIEGHSTRRGAEETEVKRGSLEQQVANVLGSQGITFDCGEIEACHTLSSKTKNTPPAKIIRFPNRKKKNALLKQGWTLKGSYVYINEHLTITRLRVCTLKKLKRIQANWTFNCMIITKQNGSTPEEAKVHVIRVISELDRYGA